MRFLADMGISQRVVAQLRDAGHDAIHLRDEGMQRSPDATIFQKAIIEQRIVLTFDLDFGEIAALSGDDYASVVLFRLMDTRPTFVWQRLLTALAQADEDLRSGAIVVVEDQRIRVRRLPIGG